MAQKPNSVSVEEAVTKMCPFTPAPWGTCMADKCMAWRKDSQIGIDHLGRKTDRDMDGRVRWVDTGFCGRVPREREE